MKQQLIFVVGCARSGTTWLQLLVSQHPAVATLLETHLFPDYIGPAFERWRKADEQGRNTGLTKLMSRSEFVRLCRCFAEQTLRVALLDKPQAAFILEKTPNHVYHSREILELFPTAYFVHIIRDPRAVAASLLEAGRSWGKSWAPQNSLAAGGMWREAVLAGRGIRTRTDRYIEVSYESLLEAPETELGHVLQMIGLEPDPGFCREAAKACSARRMSREDWGAWVPKTMEILRGNTIRKGQAGCWKEELSEFEISAVEYAAGDSLEAFGYKHVARRRLVGLERLIFSPMFYKLRQGVARRIKSCVRAV